MADLVTLAETKTYLGVSGTSDDSLIAQLISQISAAVESHTARSFTPVSVIEILDGDIGDGKLVDLILAKRPVNSISGVIDLSDGSTVATASYAFDAVKGMLYQVDSATDAPLNVPWGAGRRRQLRPGRQRQSTRHRSRSHRGCM